VKPLSGAASRLFEPLDVPAEVITHHRRDLQVDRQALVRLEPQRVAPERPVERELLRGADLALAGQLDHGRLEGDARAIEAGAERDPRHPQDVRAAVGHREDLRAAGLSVRQLQLT
jgi:hypothetical protein